MGCASSLPIMNGTGPAGVIESAKEIAKDAANDATKMGGEVIHGKLKLHV